MYNYFADIKRKKEEETKQIEDKKAQKLWDKRHSNIGKL